MHSSFSQRALALVALLAIAGLTACKGSDGGGTTPTGSFSLDVSPASGSGVATMSQGATGSTLTVSVGAAVVPGDYTVTVHGNGAGVAEKTATFVLTVTADPGSFVLTIGSEDVTIPQGSSAPATITVVRTAPFTGAVGLTVTSIDPATAGVTASFAPTTIPAGSTTSILTITVVACQKR